MQAEQAFRVRATIRLADNSVMEKRPFDVLAVDRDQARAMVTRQYVLSVTDDKGRPIRNVKITSVRAIRRATKVLSSTA